MATLRQSHPEFLLDAPSTERVGIALNDSYTKRDTKEELEHTSVDKEGIERNQESCVHSDRASKRQYTPIVDGQNSNTTSDTNLTNENSPTDRIDDEGLTRAFDRARRSFSGRRPSPPPVTFGWDRDTLLDIVGDFDATLRECYRLVRTNKSYAAASGPVRNVQWNAMVMPSVERLRHRILMHQSKI